MANKTLLDALKAMGKATHREIAAHLEIDPVEALTMLREEREQNRCEFFNGTWWIAGAKKGSDDKSVSHDKIPSPESVPEITGQKVIEALLRENGEMDTVSLAKALNRNARGVVSTMSGLMRRGEVVKIGKGKGCKWTLPPVDVEPTPTVVDVNMDNAICTEKESREPVTESVLVAERDPVDVDINEVVKSIPSFTEGQKDGVFIPSPVEVARMIRKAKCNLRELEQIRRISIAAKKYSKTLTRMAELKREE
ncbi:TPA: DUF1627 domain-containing protein [Salmonella enterica]|nr:DUF1627 domain-containing protein [Salmonella enterica]HEB0795969.1 DUF1627 domain-containing protein [Salmonella enterica]HEB0806477.1 DUF1627 domain-containing protein [Salmonella enterica]HEB0810776.1 DUF1627 domain-containing protein [Salmonella enterica]HEB0815351.1 DUF1627 domain-containing protein [Salmonella enterica]